MKSRIVFGLAAALATGIAATAFVPAAEAGSHVCEVIAKNDRIRDGKLDIVEAIIAGKKTFKALNPDRDGTLDYAEASSRIGPKTFDRFNKIKRKGLDRVEWTRLVKARFKRANRDGDRTIECDELMTRAGHRLLAVITY